MAPARHSIEPSRVTQDWVAIIDDHLSLRSSLTRALRIEGIRSESFGSAEEFLARALGTAPCCLVVDMQLPSMGGHELAHHLERERPPLPPAIFITGHDDLFTSLDSCALAHARLRKPFAIEALLALVKPLVARHGTSGGAASNGD